MAIRKASRRPNAVVLGESWRHKRQKSLGAPFYLRRERVGLDQCKEGIKRASSLRKKNTSTPYMYRGVLNPNSNPEGEENEKGRVIKSQKEGGNPGRSETLAVQEDQSGIR